MKSLKSLSLIVCTFALLIGTANVSAENCCEKAKKAGKECEHKCCVDAAKNKKTCEKCNPKSDSKSDKKK